MTTILHQFDCEGSEGHLTCFVHRDGSVHLWGFASYDGYVIAENTPEVREFLRRVLALMDGPNDAPSPLIVQSKEG